MPRFGKEFKMYTKIIPSLTLDVKPLMDLGKEQCMLLGEALSDEVSLYGDRMVI